MADTEAVMETSVTLAQDPVSFLAKLREECPDIMSIFTASQVRMLSHDPLDPYTQGKVDEEYLSDASICQHFRVAWKRTSLNLTSFLLKPSKKFASQDLETFERKKSALTKVTERAKLIIESRLKATEEKLGECGLPRIVRLCRKYKFTENETKLAIYSLICQFTRYPQDTVQKVTGTDCITACQFLDIPIMDVLDFLAKDRPHMKQGLFPAVRDNYILSSSVSFDSDFCKVLMGSSVSSKEFLKLEQTALADVVVEEPGNEHLKSVDSTKTAESKKPAAPVEQKEVKEPIVPKEELEAAKEVLDLDTILRLEREKEKAREPASVKKETKEKIEDANKEDGSEELKPYKKDLDYLDDYFQLVLYKLKVNSIQNRMDMEAQSDYASKAQTLSLKFQRQKREALTKLRVHENQCDKRFALTKEAGPWIPRLERMVESRNLSQFEKDVLLVLIGAILQPNRFNVNEVRIGKNLQVGTLLNKFCSNLEDQIAHRKYFYKSASLVREGMVVVHSSGISGDLSSATIEVDRRMVDFCVGLDTEFSEVVEGSHLYFPKTKFEQVILPKDQKDLILNTVSNFESYKRCRKKMGLDDAITYGAGMVMLFHGAPGTGKTMMANALANKLNKKVLLINFPSLGVMSADENFKFIFREAKINDALLFFDECEAIFESREKMGGHKVNLLLTEIERHDGMIILATNRPYDLDEAMHRRIMIAIEFRQPDHLLRKAIWESHMPEQMKLADDIALNDLALRFELTGGFIKNAILSALSIAVSRDGDSPVVSQKDLLQGASLQLRGRLRMKDFDRRVVPAAGLDEVVVEESIMKQLKQIVQFEKTRAILFGQWGFAKRNHKGLTVLLHGSPGTGKTLVAEAIGYEVGKALKVVNCGELLSKWVGESTKNIDAIFQEAQHQDAILVFDEAEGLFGQRTSTTTSTDRYANIDVGVLLYHIERFPGIVILTTNLIENLDMAFFRRLRFVLHLDVPRQNLRAQLWKLIIPSETPLADDVDFERLSRHDICGGSIKNVVFRAAAEAALRTDGARQVTMKDLEESCEEEIAKSTKRLGFRRQDSDTVGIYN